MQFAQKGLPGPVFGPVPGVFVSQTVVYRTGKGVKVVLYVGSSDI